MPKLEYLQQKKLTPADELRERLVSLEERLVKIRSMASIEALQLLHDMDQTTLLFSQLEAGGLNLLPERGRFQTIQAHLRSRVSVLLKAVGGAAALAQRRPAPPPAEERWWWYIDQMVFAQQRRRRRNWLIALLVLALLVGGAVLVFNTILAPSPEVVARLEAENSAFNAIEIGDFPAALAAVEAGLAKVPAEPSLVLLKGLLLETLGQEDAAAQTLAAAEKAFADPITYYMFRSQLRLRLNQLEKAEQDARLALELDDASAGAWLLLAQALELQNRLGEASAAYNQASQLAFESGDNEIFVLARLALARLAGAPPN